MIEIRNISKTLGKKKVLENISLSINNGDILGLVGINGVGKSTLLRCISGVYHVEEGDILFDNKSVYENNEVKKDILFIPDESAISAKTTINSLLDFFSSFYEVNRKSFFEYLNIFKVNITSKPLNTFSKGMKRRVLLCFALAIHPKYLLLDEAFDGLDPLGKVQFKKLLDEQMSKFNMSVIIASHSLRELTLIANTFAMLNSGKIISQGDVDNKESTYFKVQMAFNEEIDLNSFNEKTIVQRNKMGRIVTLIVNQNKEEIEPTFSKYSPLTIDILPLSFDERFVYETEAFENE
ncbi:MAG: ABC transporter ATP-binding protein [Bacilli bacterium]|nr:ABC transporter ATP-binding protein [Bacillales bacterium]MDY2575617.1 ABC transporter ATP-binding protein [Bacilli bacterium]